MAEDLPGKLGYDRTIVVFSPDGRLFQVEYAKETVKLGPTSVGAVFKDGVVIAATKTKNPLAVKRDDDKVHEVDTNIGVSFSGLLSDARIMIERARLRAQVYKITYDEPIEVASLVRFIGDLKQSHTQYAGLRPVGISFLIGGVDDNPSLYETDPGGSIFEWHAQAIGRGTEIARKVLETDWKPDMTKDACVGLVTKAMKKAEKNLDPDNLEMVVITKDGVSRLTQEERDQVLK